MIMSFWNSELGDVTGSSGDAFVKELPKRVPDQSMALAKIESFVNEERNGEKYLLITWELTEGDFKGYKVRQKIKVWGDSRDKDPVKTRHRALNMFKLLYQLFSMSPKHGDAPTDADLSLFAGKIAGLKIRETEPNAEGKQYNWVSEVHDAKGFKCETGTSIVVTHVNKSYAGVDSALTRNSQISEVKDEDIPW